MIVNSRIILALTYAASALLTPSVRSAPAVNTRPDRLSPLTFIHERLRSIIDEKLLLTPANCGRMITFPSTDTDGEFAVSVNCTDPDASQSPCYVTITKASRSLGVALSEHGYNDDSLRSDKSLAVNRCDALLPHSIALLFRSSLLALMPKEGDTPQTRTISDNDRVEFWLTATESAARGAERGEQYGSRVSSLIHMGRLFVDYCTIPQSERNAMLRRIQDEGARIGEKDLINAVKNDVRGAAQALKDFRARKDDKNYEVKISPAGQTPIRANNHSPNTKTIGYEASKQYNMTGYDADGSLNQDASIGLGHKARHFVDDYFGRLSNDIASDPWRFPNCDEAIAVYFENVMRAGRSPDEPGRPRPEH